MTLKNRILSMLLVLVILASLSVSGIQAADEGSMEELIRDQYDTYLKNELPTRLVAETALWDMANHALWGGSKNLTMDEDDAVSALVFGSELYRNTICTALASAVQLMQDTGRDEPGDWLYMKGSTQWYTSTLRHTLREYDHKGTLAEDIGVPFVDNLQNEADTDDTYYGYILIEQDYSGAVSDYDRLLGLLCGSSLSRPLITVKSVDEAAGTITYQARLFLADNFNFNGSYDGYENEGLDMSLARLLTYIGKLLSGTVIHEFFWSVTGSFEFTLPYEKPDETGRNYRWEYDEAAGELVSADGGCFTSNAVTPIYGENNTYPYYRLDDTIRLMHDRPWVLEFSCKGNSTAIVSTTDDLDDCYPLIFRCTSGRALGTYHPNSGELITKPYTEYYVFGGHYEVQTLDEAFAEQYNDGDGLTTFREYYGYQYTDVFSSRLQHYRMENHIAEDGTNTVYLTITEEVNGKQTILVPRIPMCDYYRTYYDFPNQSYVYTKRMPEDFNWFNGQDLYLNYIGTQEYRVSSVIRAVSVWENGPDSGHTAAPVEFFDPATCERQGDAGVRCDGCGMKYTTYAGLPLGHDPKTTFSWQRTGGITADVLCANCGEGDQDLPCALSLEGSDDQKTLLVEAETAGGPSAPLAVFQQTGENVSVTVSDLIEGVQILAATYDSNGRLIGVGETPAPGQAAKVFLLDRQTYAPLRPAYQVD